MPAFRYQARMTSIYGQASSEDAAQKRDIRMKLKILALSYLFPNPVQTSYGIFVYNRIQALAELSDIRVIAPLQWYPFRDRLRPALAGLSRIAKKETIGTLKVHYPRFPVIPRYMKWFDAISYFLAVCPVLRRLRKEGFDFDLVDVHWTYPDILAGYLLARMAGKPFIVTIRGREALYFEENDARTRMLHAILQKADGVIALSHELAALVTAIGVSPSKIHVALNGVDTGNFRPESKEGARRRLNLPHDKKIILSVGRLTEAKGHQHIIEALPALARRGSVELHIIGGINPETDYSANLQELIGSLRLDNAHLHRDIPHAQLGSWYNAADLFCLASHGEGCPNVVLEALACGTPVVTTNVGAVEELIEHGRDGYIVDDAGTIPEALARGLSAQWDRERIAGRMAEMSWQACARKVDGIYRETLARFIADEAFSPGAVP
jgi:glycosyltransferase involved in cell wall biosynthesis